MNNGAIRVGSGRYDWYFSPDPQCLVEKLIITIDFTAAREAWLVNALRKQIGYMRAAVPYWSQRLCGSRRCGCAL
jgi:hypothetical protein